MRKRKKEKNAACTSPDTEISFYDFPTSEQIEGELKHEKYKRRYRGTLKSTVFLLVIVAAAALLIATMWTPVLRVYGTSMTPTLIDGDIVVLMKDSNLETGDVIAFYYNNKILIKRVIAQAGDIVDMDDDGNISVNGVALDEPYVSQPGYGECDITFPYEVPDNRLFVLGDCRSVSTDSRNSQVGCVSEEQIIGKLVFRVWPVSRLGGI